MTQGLQSLHLAISTTHRDYRDDGRSALDSIFDCANSPLDGFMEGSVRCAKEDEHAQVDVVIDQKSGRPIESREIETLIESRHGKGMNRLEADRNFQSSPYLS